MSKMKAFELIEAINKGRPAAVKGQFLKSVTIAPTMGPGIKIDKNSFDK